MVSSVEDLVNQALRRIKYRTPIGSIYEGSAASRVALEIYSQARDDVMAAGTYSFARRSAVLSLLKTAPPGGYGAAVWASNYPPIPWIYEYAYPDACLEIRSLNTTPVLMPRFDPSPNLFVIGNDQYMVPARRVVLTNTPRAIAIYTGQITDMSTWDVNYVDAFIAELSVRLSDALVGDPNAWKERVTEAQQSVAVASQRQE